MTSLTGWGRTASTVAVVRDFDRVGDELLAAVKDLGPRGGIARGLGRSYGDPAQNGGGTVLRLLGRVHDVELDDRAGTATIPAGVSIDDLLRLIVPRGFFVPVTPGTRFVSIGGAIASDIHGKNHHVEGSFGNHVTRLTLLLADGTVIGVGPDQRPELFWATVGGMGLTGLILDATVKLLPITTSRCAVDTARVGDLDTLLALMEDGDQEFRYSVAWVDLLAKGANLGRSVLTRGDHATVDQLRPRDAVEPLAYDPRHLATVPPLIPRRGVITRATVVPFNELWYRKAPRRRIAQIQSIPAYFHPLDAVGDWNRLYGRHGFIQYQFVVPFGQERALRTVVERLAAFGAASFVNVLKRFGAANPGPLSFPTPGWTLTVDLAASTHGLAALLHSLDDVVFEAGGRHYLAKDAHTTPAAVRRGYPRLAEWQAIRNSVDPEHVWTSDLSRRLQLH